MSSEREVGIFSAEYPRFPGKADLPWVSRGLRRGRKTYPMDNRLRFLYRMISELGGHRKGREPEMERPVQAKEP